MKIKNALGEKQYVLLSLLCAIPVLAAVYPPMVDLPQHAAQITAIRAMLGDGWRYAHMFDTNLFTPYLLGYGLVLALSYIVGTLWATKLVIAAAFVMLPWSAKKFCDTKGIDRTWCLAFLVLPFGFAYEWGFLNFIVAAPFGFLFLSAVSAIPEKKPAWGSYAKIALWLHFLFFAHVLITAFFCIIAMLLLADPWKGFRNWIRRCLPIFSILPLTLIWLIVSHTTRAEAANPIMWMIGTQRILDFLPALVSAPSVVTGQLIGAAALAIPFIFGAKLKKTPWAYGPFILYSLWMLLFPHYIAGTFFTYQRFGLLGLPFYYLCFERSQGAATLTRTPLMRFGLLTIVIAMIAWHGVRVMAFNQETQGYREVMSHAKPKGRILMLAFDPTSKVSRAPVMVHFAGWYQAENYGLAEFNFARFWVSPLRYKKNSESEILQGFEWLPGTFDWKKHRGDLYDYILLVSPQDASDWMEDRSEGSMGLVSRSGSWQLFGKQQQPQSKAN